MSATIEMPKYRCHKEVWALKIKEIKYDPNNPLAGAEIIPENTLYGIIEVDIDYLNKRNPKVGGYYIVYSDDYKSYSPAKAFEEGYTLIEK